VVDYAGEIISFPRMGTLEKLFTDEGLYKFTFYIVATGFIC